MAPWPAIVCSSVIEYVEEDTALLGSFHSWLAAGGVALAPARFLGKAVDGFRPELGTLGLAVLRKS